MAAILSRPQWVKARTLLNADAVLILYYSYPHPYLWHYNHVWRSTYVTNLQKLIVLQERMMQMISGSGFRDHTVPVLIIFVDLDKYMIGRLVFRYHIKVYKNKDKGLYAKHTSVKPLITREAHLFETWL